METQKKINFHTHSVFCDGHDTLEEMVQEAINLNFDILGFSGHSIYPFSTSWHIAVNQHKEYISEIRRLQKKYEDKISIRAGFEADYFPCVSSPDKDNYKEFTPDYIIGSVHYVVNENGNFTVDDSTENVKKGIEEIYKGDTKRVVCDYFSAQRKMLNSCTFDIWGHPDLIRKRNEALRIFDENESWYKEELKLTAKAAEKAGVIAEINTGAIARGAMDSLYPSEQFLEMLFNHHVPVMINSDCHNKKDLDCAFDRALQMAKKIGYKELCYPEAGSIKSIKI